MSVDADDECAQQQENPAVGDCTGEARADRRQQSDRL